MPSVYSYTNYREVLAAVLHSSKGRNSSFSLRSFATRISVDPGNLARILKGQRNLSHTAAARVAVALSLRPRETQYFTLLVSLAHARNPSEKQSLCEALTAQRQTQLRLKELPPTSFEYFSSWYNVVVREYLACCRQPISPNAIAAALEPPITPRQAKASLALLLRLGFIIRTADGSFRQADSLVTTPDSWESTAVHAFQSLTARLGLEALNRHPKTQRDISTLTLGLSEPSVTRVKHLLQQVRQQLLAIANEDTAPERVYQLNLQLFPVTKQNRGGNT
jgi:uncharacterized protein (TIGR02147 family)